MIDNYGVTETTIQSCPSGYMAVGQIDIQIVKDNVSPVIRVTLGAGY